MPSPSANKKHSRLSPSKSGSWRLCKASIGFCEKNADRLPPDVASPHADEGSLAHSGAEALLKGKKFKFVDVVMREHITGFTDYVEGIRGSLSNCEMYVEQTIPLYYDKTQVGTADVILVADGTVWIIDLKYGAGVSVEAQWNSQLVIYLKSALEKLKIKLKPTDRVHLVIYQPRAKDGRVVREWGATMAQIDAFAGEIADAALDIIADPHNQPFHPAPDTVCRWCRAKPICPAYAGHLLGETPAAVATSCDTPTAPLFPSADSLTDEQIAKVVAVEGDLRDWLKSVVALAESRMMAGDPVPHTKLVTGRGSRDWSDEEEAFRVLRQFIPREECHTKKLLSPSQAEERLKTKKGLRKQPTTRGSNLIAALIVSTPGEPKLVHETDPRHAIDAASILGSQIDNTLL